MAYALETLALVYRSGVAYAWFICMLLFAVYFPERAAWDRRHPRLKWTILAPAMAAYTFVVFERICSNEGRAAQAFIQPVRHIADIVRPVLFYSCLALSLVILLMKLSGARDADDRRRLRVLFFGLAISFLPAVILEGLLERVLGMKFSPWVKLLAYTPFVLFPLTLAYVTVVQRALDVRAILGEGLQYAMARRGLVLFQIVTSAFVVLLVALLSGRMTLLQRAGITGLGVGIIFLTSVGIHWIRNRLDRRFFREAYNAEQILARLSDSVGSLVELQPLLTTVATRIAEALHITEIAVFLCERNSYRLAFAFGYSQPPQAVFSNESSTVGELQRAKQALPVYVDDPRSWISRIGRQEYGELSRLGTQLLRRGARNYSDF